MLQYTRADLILTRLGVFARSAIFAIGLACITNAGGVAEESTAYIVEVSDVAVKVGEHTVLLATLRTRDGYRILHSYNNRVIKLSSEDDSVAFDREIVPATVQDETLIFAIGLRATKSGKHPINGLFRVGYIHGADEMAMVSLRLIANVTGTE